jgi:ethanolamine utilization protein EutP (predicted NTPase)
MQLTKYENTLATLRVLLVGMSGSGKTTLAATLAKKYNIIWIDIENAVDTLAKLPDEWKARIRLVKIPDSAAVPMAAQTVQKLFKEKKGKICDKHGVINCPLCVRDNLSFEVVDFTTLDPKTDVVVLDGITQLGYSFMSHLTKTQAIDYKPLLDDWGGLRKNCEYFASNVQATEFNLICTALPQDVQMEDGKTKLVPQFGSQGMSQAIGAKFSAIVYCDTRNKKHVAFSASTASNTVLTKSRAGYRIEDQIGDPDLCPMFDSYLEGTPQVAVQPTTTKLPINQQVTQNLRAASLLGKKVV